MKAPNGEPTKLTEKQWLQVRTAAFKEWFGDWEGDPANASKVVDANGDPLVVYHGSGWDPMTEEAGKAVFKHGAIRNTSEGVGFYFTPSRELAEGWGDAGGYFLDLRDPVDPYAPLDLLSEDEYYDIIEDEDLDREDGSIEDALDEARKAKLRGKLREVLDILEGKGYAFNEQIWPDLLDTLSPRTTEGVLDGLLGAEVFIDGNVDNERFVSDLRGAEWEAFGIDGYHSPSYSNGAGAYIAFSPTQIKSATDNRGTFDAGDLDIYHQDAVDSGGGQLSLFDNSGLIDERDALPRTEAADAFDRDDPETWSEGARKDEALAILEELDALDEATTFPTSVGLWMEGPRKAEAEDIDEQLDALMAFDAEDVDTWSAGPRRDRMDALLASFVEDEDEGVLSDEVTDDAAYWVDDSPRKAEAQEVMARLLALQEQGQLTSDEAQDLRDRLDQLVYEESEAVAAEMAELTRAEEKANEDELDALDARWKALRAEEEAVREARAEELWDRLDELADEEEGETESYEQDAVAQTRTEAFKAWFGDWEMAAAVRAAKDFLDDSEPIGEISGEEFQKSELSLVDAVTEYYEKSGNAVVVNKELGEVKLDRRSVKDSLGHGMSRMKAAAYALVPNVIRDGFVYARETNWKGRGYDTAVLIANVKISGKDYVCEVIVRKSDNRQGFYLHGVEIKKDLESVFKTAINGTPPKSKLIISQYWRKANDVSKVVGEGGRPEVWYHATGKGEFSVFQSGNSAGLIYFGQTPKDAKRGARSKARVMPVYLNVKDPVNTKETAIPWYEAEDSFKVARWKREGHDGVYVQDEAGVSLAVFSPAQIKSATGNVGTFDAGDADIYHQTYSEDEAAAMGLGEDTAPAAETETAEDPGAGWERDEGIRAGATRGRVEFHRDSGEAIITLMRMADPSTFPHEMWHVCLDDLMLFGRREDAPEHVRKDWETVTEWLGVRDLDYSLFALAPEARRGWTAEQKARYKADMARWHAAQEKFAEAGEEYIKTGKAPSEALQGTFDRLRAWLLRIYDGIRGDAEIPDEVREVFDRMLATQGEMTAALEAREKFADAGEAYFQTGEAPSEALKGAFERIRAWLLIRGWA